MTLNSFLQKQNITLSPSVQQLCRQGLKHLADAVDSNHGREHVESILSGLHELLNHETFPRKIRFDILLPAIIWHDCWKSGRLSTSPLTLLFDQLWDGHGSRRVFDWATHNSTVPKKTRRIISRLIRDHSWLALENHAHLEYKILCDLDGLEEWRWERFNQIVNQSGWWIVRLAGEIYAKFGLERQTEKQYHFSWSKKEFLKRKRQFGAPGGI